MEFFDEIFTPYFDSSKVILNGISLNNEYRCIEKKMIKEIHLINCNENTTSSLFEQLESYDGWVHLTNGIKYSIKNKKIQSIRISEEYLQTITEMTWVEIEKTFSIPDLVLIEDDLGGLFSSSPISYLLIYEKQKITFFIDYYKKNITAINIGAIDYSLYFNSSRDEYIKSIEKESEADIENGWAAFDKALQENVKKGKKWWWF